MSEFLTTSFMVIAAILSIVGFVQVAFYNGAHIVPLFDWIRSGTLEVSWQLRIDTLTAIMLVVVNSISALVHVYSIGYMHDDPHRPRFFAYLSLFTFAMLMLVTSDNFLQLFFGWEGVGLASYLLIGFWFQKSTANAAAIKAFVVNRVGDFGLILGIAAIYFSTGSLQFDEVFAAAPILEISEFSFLGCTVSTLTVICLLLFMGAMGKSAQFLLHTWLPDAMEGPTPVSALIHAATMVTAGVFLLARCSPLFELSSYASEVIIVVGAITAFFAATVALVQTDIKRVIAYSTCSQLGYMFVALGLGAYQVAIFHLVTHAFFKALLFLGAGAVIHAVDHEQDLRKMGGLRHMIPVTWFLMLIGTLALTGFPFLSGYFSKDAIIEASFVSHSYVHMFAFVLLIIAACLTAFYSWRLMFVCFYGKTHLSSDQLRKVQESPVIMMNVLFILALGAVFVGGLMKRFFIGGDEINFWQGAIFTLSDNHILHDLHNVPLWVKLLPLFMMFLGFIIAWYCYIKRPDIPKKCANMHDMLYTFLLKKWYFDYIYDVIIVRPIRFLSLVLWKIGDGFINSFGPDGVAKIVHKVMTYVVRVQSGYIYHYAFAMFIGVLSFVTWFMLWGI